MTRRLLHWKPLALHVDGAACGRKRVPFTGELTLVTCVRCINAQPRMAVLSAELKAAYDAEWWRARE